MSSSVNKYYNNNIQLAKENTHRTSSRRRKFSKNVYDNVIKPHALNNDLKKYSTGSTIVKQQNNKAPYRGSFTKLFAHDSYGFVVGYKYNTLIKALVNGDNKYFWDKLITNGKLVDPQASISATAIGYDPKSVSTDNPAPSINSQEAGSELVELYCMAGCRDVPFDLYTTSNTDILNSINYLNYVPVLGYYAGPLNSSGLVDGTNIFRGVSAGDLMGPYISQFLWLPVPELNLSYITEQLYPSPVAVDFLKTTSIFLNNQNNGTVDPNGPITFNSARYVSSGRDLTNIVHNDDNLTWGYKIVHILLYGLKCPLSTYNPYNTNNHITGFVNFGMIDICSMIGEVTKLAMLSAWYVKWNIYLRLRPEAYAYLLHLAKTDVAYSFLTDDLPTNLQNSTAPLTFANSDYGTYLLSTAYTEGAPAHPSFPSGHAVFAGATATILKAWFNSTLPIYSLTNYHSSIPALPVDVNPPSYNTLVQYTGSNATNMTVASELDKFATNIAFGRNFAGIHYRSDGEEGILLGEKIALKYLRDKAKLYPKSAGFKKWKVPLRSGQVVYIE